MILLNKLRPGRNKQNQTRSLYLLLLLTIIFQVYSSGISAADRVAPGKDTLIIVAFGNSITAERKTVNEVFAQRLPGLLAGQKINAKVINSGIPGSHTGRRTDHDLFKIPHGRDRFETAVLSHKPDWVIIGFGTNDSYIDSKVKGGSSRIPLKDYRENLVYFIEQLKAIDARIILMAPNLLGANYPDFQNKRLLKYVRVVRRLSRKYDTLLVDNFQGFIDYQRQTGVSYDQLMLDGCHPNDKGHELIAGHLVDALLSVEK